MQPHGVGTLASCAFWEVIWSMLVLPPPSVLGNYRAGSLCSSWEYAHCLYPTEPGTLQGLSEPALKGPWGPVQWHSDLTACCSWVGREQIAFELKGIAFIYDAQSPWATYSESAPTGDQRRDFMAQGGAYISLMKSPCSGGSQIPYPHEKRGPKEPFQTFFFQGRPLSTSPKAMGWLHSWNQICHCCWLFNLNFPLLCSPFLFCLCVLILGDQNILSALVLTSLLCQGSAYPPL